MSNALQALTAKVAQGKRIMIYGAGSQGRGVLRSLRSSNIEPAGFIDRNPDLQGRNVGGLLVTGLSELESTNAAEKLFTIIAAFFFEREVAAMLESRGFVKGEDYLPYSELKPRDYAIEVSGICNLRCISCPRADRRPEGRNACMMDLETFQKVITKIRSEDPFVSNVQLYQWGEPTLNASLPEMIRYARNHSILCTVSSNLNHLADFRALIDSRPECMRLSVSGLEENYEITHTGGDWETFVTNAEIVSKLRHELYPEMKIELYFHQYKHSIGTQQEQIARLCKKLDFEFHPVPAYIISLDDVLNYCEGKPLPSPAVQARELLLVDIDEGLRRAQQDPDQQCDSLRVIMINADLSVSTCMMFYNPEENTIADNYLETPLEKILERRSGAKLCARCRKHAIHRYCSAYAKLSEEIRY